MAAFSAGRICGIKRKAKGAKATEYDYLKCEFMEFMLESCPIAVDALVWKKKMARLLARHYEGLVTLFCNTRNYGHGKIKEFGICL